MHRPVSFLTVGGAVEHVGDGFGRRAGPAFLEGIGGGGDLFALGTADGCDAGSSQP